jgi:hypothetical protein
VGHLAIADHGISLGDAMLARTDFVRTDVAQFFPWFRARNLEHGIFSNDSCRKTNLACAMGLGWARKLADGHQYGKQS